jgi:hypothetical protein
VELVYLANTDTETVSQLRARGVYALDASSFERLSKRGICEGSGAFLLSR